MHSFVNIKADFPIFKNDPELVYLDSAATALKPVVVLDTMDTYYQKYSSNVSRGLYPIAEEATDALDRARGKVATFIGASQDSTVFVASATHGINIVASGLREKITEKNNIVVTDVEHHSNFLPWKELALIRSAELRSAPAEKSGLLSPDSLASLVDEQTLIVAFTAVSNVLGLINPVKEIIQAIREKNKKVLILVDACQAVGHTTVSLSDWDADFIVFSAHKLLGPTGVGVLAGKKESLELLGPVNVGGGTILDPLCTPAEYKGVPERLEGGTPNIAGIVGLGAAVDYVNALGIANIREHEKELTAFTLQMLQDTFGDAVHILGSTDLEKRAGILSFSLAGVHPHDVAHILGENNVCVRAGEHCAKPLHRSLDITASVRVSFHVYTEKSDIEKFIHELKKVQTFFA